MEAKSDSVLGKLPMPRHLVYCCPGSCGPVSCMEVALMPTSTPLRRLFVFYVPYIILAGGFLFGLWLVDQKASRNDLSSERAARLVQDCQARVEARDVLRDIIIEAYVAPPNTPVDRVALIEERRNQLLHRVPPLRCAVKEDIPLPVPVT